MSDGEAAANAQPVEPEANIPNDDFADSNAVTLLMRAQRPLEAVMRTTEGELFAQAEACMMEVVRRIAGIPRQAAQRLQQKTHAEEAAQAAAAAAQTAARPG